MNEIIEGVIVAVVGEFIVGGWKLLEALISNRIEVAAELRILRQHHRRRAARHQRVDHRLPAVLPHFRLDLDRHGCARVLLGRTEFFLTRSRVGITLVEF